MNVWIHILIEANWADKEWKKVVIPRGSFVTSREHLAGICGLSVMQVRRALDNLVSTGEVEKFTTNKYTIIKVCKYEDYQVFDEGTYPTNNQQITNKQPQRKNNRIQDNKATNKSVCINNLTSTNEGVGGVGDVQVITCPTPTDTQYLNFVEWCRKMAPEVLRMKRPMKEDEFRKLHQEFGSRALADIIGEMGNKADLLKKYNSAYLTALKWLRRQRDEKKSTEPEAKFRGAAEQSVRMEIRYQEKKRLEQEQQQEIENQNQPDYGIIKQLSEVRHPQSQGTDRG